MALTTTCMKKLEEDLRDLDVRFNELQVELMQKFDNEGHDIGDACGILELIANTMTWEEEKGEEHDSYTVQEMIQAVAEFYCMPFETIEAIVEDVMLLTNSQYARLLEKLY